MYKFDCLIPLQLKIYTFLVKFVSRPQSSELEKGINIVTLILGLVMKL